MITEFDITFRNPQFEILFLIIPLIFFLHFYFIIHVKRRALKFGNFNAMKRVYTDTTITKNLTTLFFILLLTSLLIVSLIDPSVWYKAPVTNSDYYIVLDSGASMNARDMDPDRFMAAKKTSTEIVNNIKNSKIGFISFSGTILQNEPLTDDKSLVLNAIQDSKIENTGTDIGLALVSAIQGFTVFNSSKTIILLSDGQETAGTSLSNAITQSKEKHIKIITIGVGTKEGGKFLDVPDAQGVLSHLDEESLMAISKATESTYLNLKKDYNITTFMAKLNEDNKAGYVEYNMRNSTLLAILVVLFIFWLLDNTRFRIFP